MFYTRTFTEFVATCQNVLSRCCPSSPPLPSVSSAASSLSRSSRFLSFNRSNVCFSALKDLSVVEILEGVIGELTTHSLWGGRGREGSKGIQLFMTISLVLVHTACLLCVAFVQTYGPARVQIMDQATIRQPAAIAFIVFGWHQRMILSYQSLPHLTSPAFARRKHSIYTIFCFSFFLNP